MCRANYVEYIGQVYMMYTYIERQIDVADDDDDDDDNNV